MMLWTLPLLPIVAGATLWAVAPRLPEPRRRLVLGLGGGATMLVALLLAVWAAVTTAAATHVMGAGLVASLSAGPIAGPAAVLVAVVTAVVVAYASVHEDADGLGRLVGLLVVFAGTMLLLVLADDLLTLTAAWELVGAVSWALIGHEWRRPDAPRAAAHAFNATRFGGLGLFLASGAAFVAVGSLQFDALAGLSGSARHVVAAGVLVAAAAKSGQVPFAPWLFSAMAGPTSVSALLHSSTMVAAGAYALVRLHPVLEPVGWFGPATIAIGLLTALTGGVVAALQGHAKKLLAASTSAQYGLMLVAVGAGYPTVAALHLLAHAVFKAQLFLSAGVAMEATGSATLTGMRLGRALPVVAWSTLVASLALAAVPPLGAAFTKDEVLTAASHEAVWVGLLVVIAGALSAVYATRYQLLAFGPSGPAGELRHRPHPVEHWAMVALALSSLVLGVLWLPGVHEAAADLLGGRLPTAASWELPASVGAALAAVYATWTADRAGRLWAVPHSRGGAVVADWLGLPAATRAVVVTPTLALAGVLARFDDRVVDAGVRGVARLATVASGALARPVERGVDDVVRAVWRFALRLADGGARLGERAVDAVVDGVAALTLRAGSDARRTQTGLVHHQYVVIALGLGVVVVAALLGR